MKQPQVEGRSSLACLRRRSWSVEFRGLVPREVILRLHFNRPVSHRLRPKRQRRRVTTRSFAAIHSRQRRLRKTSRAPYKGRPALCGRKDFPRVRRLRQRLKAPVAQLCVANHPPLGQILIVTARHRSGAFLGRLRFRRCAREMSSQFRPGVKATWHGASKPGSAVTHIAIQEALQMRCGSSGWKKSAIRNTWKRNRRPNNDKQELSKCLSKFKPPPTT